MKKELKALLDKKRALAAEADGIYSAAEKAGSDLTAEQKSRIDAMKAESEAASADLDKLVASMPDDPEADQKAAIEKASKEAADAAWKAARDLHADIAAQCHLSGFSAKASPMIKEAKTLSEVVASLQAAKVNGSPKELNTHAGGGNADGPTWDKAIARQNARLGA